MSTRIKLSIKTVAFTLILVTMVIVLYSILTGGYTLLLNIDPLTIVIALIFYMISWIISAYRLRLMHILLDGEEGILPFKHYLYARLIGGLVAYLTPSAIGGELARAYYMYSRLNTSYSRYFALTIYEVYYDVMIVNIVALGFALYRFPHTIPVILVGMGSICFWIIAYNIFNNIVSPQVSNPIIRKLLFFIENSIVSRVKTLSNGYSSFGKAFNDLSRSANFKFKASFISLTLAIYFFMALTIYTISLSFTTKHLLRTFIDAFTAVFFSLALGALPTPGGAIAIEYGLSITLDPVIVITARSLIYYSTIIAGLVVLIRTGIKFDQR